MTFSQCFHFYFNTEAAPSGCAYPGDIENGHVIQGREGKIFPPGKRLEFVCKDGYSLDGVEKVYCLTDETWSDINPVCVLNDDSEGNYKK